MSKITQYTALSSVHKDDVLPIVDVHDTSMAASGTAKKVTVANLLAFGVQVLQPSGDTSGATDQAAITAAETAAKKLYLTEGTFWVTGLTKQTGTVWQCAGRNETTIKLAAGANADVIKGANFATLTGTGGTGGIKGWAIRDCTIDGNASAQSGTSCGLRVYGADFDLINVEVTNCLTDGFYSEWGSFGSDMEARVYGCKAFSNGGWGFNWRGPHDSVLDTCQAWSNTAGQFNFDGQADGTLARSCHAYLGGTTAVVRIATTSGQIQWNDSITEVGSGGVGILILSNLAEVLGGSIYDINAGTSTGIQIGDGSHSPSGVWIDTQVTNTDLACINFAGSGGGNYASLRVYQPSGTVVTGTPARTDSVVINSAGTLVAAGAMPQSNGSLLRLKLPDPGGTAGWYKLGTWKANGGGARLRITITGTGGYNADIASAGRTVITASVGNGSPTPNIQGVWYTENGNPLADSVKANKGADTSTWDIWVHLLAVFTGNSFVQVDTGTELAPSTFVWSLASGADPGSASSTLAVLHEVFGITSPASFNQGAFFGGTLDMYTPGTGLAVAEGSNAKQGTVALVAGSKVVSNTSVTASSRIFLTSNADGGTPGWLRVSARTAGTSFTITSSSGTDTSTVAYEIFEPG